MANSPDITKLAEHLREVTDRLLAHEIARGAGLYKRERHLPLLLGASWQTLSEEAIRARLQRRIRDESRRLQSGSWNADPHRLLALKQALAGEQRRAH